MKNRCMKIGCILFSVLFLSLCTGAAAAEQEIVKPLQMMQTYKDVLAGNSDYVQCNLFDGLVEEAAMTDEITAWYGFSFDSPLKFVSFAITDLDADGNPELLLMLSADFGFELLRYENGQVYGFPFFARAMEAITIDGEIHGSSGADNYGWYRVSFNGDAMATSEVCWKSDDEYPSFQYMIDDTEVTEAEFTALNDALWSKESLSWTENTLERINEVLSGF